MCVALLVDHNFFFKVFNIQLGTRTAVLARVKRAPGISASGLKGSRFSLTVSDLD